MQGFCDICESDIEKKIITIGGKDFCVLCQKNTLKNFTVNFKEKYLK